MIAEDANSMSDFESLPQSSENDTSQGEVHKHNRTHIAVIVAIVAALAIGVSSLVAFLSKSTSGSIATVSPIPHKQLLSMSKKSGTKFITGGSIQSPPTVAIKSGYAPYAKLQLVVGQGTTADGGGPSRPNGNLPTPGSSPGGAGQVQIGGSASMPTVIVFMAAWCIECHSADRAAQAQYRVYSGKVRFVGVDVADSESAARIFISQEGITFPVGLDSNQGVAQKYGVYGLPETFFVESNGKIFDHTYGPMTQVGLSQVIERLIHTS